jgi:predicted DNA-binding protein
MATKKKPGKNIPNAQRHTVQILLRLPPEVAERIEELAEAWNLTKAGAVARLVEEHDERAGHG